MRKSEREITDFRKIVGLVERCDTLRLGIHDEGAPYVVPVSFGYEVVGDRIVIYFHGAMAGRKHELIAKNPRVCVEGDICRGFVENACGGITCDYESFIGYGNAVRVSGEAAERGIALLNEHCGFPGFKCISEVFAVTAVYRIELEEITGKHRNLCNAVL
ncbi:MAG: 5-nitroimidazole antibiotic resistance protein [Clostridia bacterium]|nr:5-nitroimidazole antibiotic resistance protein [Clostridia bacterium]